MEGSGSDNRRATDSHHIQGSRQKRPYSVLRECEAGSSVAYSDGHQYKRMRGVDHGDFHYLIERKATEGHADCKPYAKKQHEADIASRGNTMKQRRDDCVSNRNTSSAHNRRKRSSTMLNLPSSDKGNNDDEDDEVVRDGGGGGKDTKQQSNNASAGKTEPSPPEKGPTQSRAPSKPTESSSQCEEASKSFSQYSSYSDQFTCAGLKSFTNYSGEHERYTTAHSSRATREHHNSFMSSSRLCTPRPESRRNPRSQMQLSPRAGGLCTSQPFVSPEKSYNTAQYLEQFVVTGGHQEMERSTPFLPTFNYPIHHYRVINPGQGMAPSNSLVPGMESAVVLQQESSSSQGSTGYLLDFSVHSRESGPAITCTRSHSGNTIESPVSSVRCPPPDDNQKGTMHYPPPLSTQGASWKMLEGFNESFYAGRFDTDNKMLTSRDPSKTKSTCDKGPSGGPDNQHVPDLS